MDSERKSIRASTAIKTEATKIRLQEMDDEKRRRKRKAVRVKEHIPTQEELLEEAKITEEENLKSLGKKMGDLNEVAVDISVLFRTINERNNFCFL